MLRRLLLAAAVVAAVLALVLLGVEAFLLFRFLTALWRVLKHLP